MNTFFNITLSAFTLVGGVFLFFPKNIFPSFYDVRYMGFMSLVNAIFLFFLPKFLSSNNTLPGALEKNQAAKLFQIFITGVIIANALGDLGLYQLYKIGFEFDKLLHFFVPFFALLFLPIIFHLRYKISISGALIRTFFVILGSALLWEFFEWLSDRLFHTHIAGLYGENILIDTKFDLLSDLLGCMLGVLFWISFPQWKNKFLINEK